MIISINGKSYLQWIAGSRRDYVGIPYVFGENTILGHLNTSYQHIHGKSFVYPDHADSVLLTSAAPAWSTAGSIIEIIPAGSLLSYPFDLHWIDIFSLSGNGEYQIDIFAGAALSEVQIGATKVNRSAVFSTEGPKRIQVPQQPAGTRISARLSDSTAGSLTCRVSVEGHYYGAP